MDTSTILVDLNKGVLSVTLNRPQIRNAFNDELIGEALELFETLATRHPTARIVVLRGSGETFCAGADLNWMSGMVSYSREENLRDSSKLARMYELIDACPLPVIGAVRGAAIGGGVGLVAVCDIVVAQKGTRFGLSEVKLGILPAVISPYVISKIGVSQARALFLTGERFDAAHAHGIGLVHRIAEDAEALENTVAELVAQLRSSGPEAVRECKKLIAYVGSHDLSDSIPFTIEAIASRRISGEGQLGMQAFLHKGKAPWTSE